MSDLVVVGFEDEYTAFEMRAALARLQNEYLIDTEDVVVVTKNRQGKVKLQQAANLSAAGAVSGGFWGTLIGLLFLNPIMGVVVGAGCGPLARKRRSSNPEPPRSSFWYAERPPAKCWKNSLASREESSRPR